MAKPIRKQGRGRPPKHGEAMTGAERQALYAKARQRDMAEVGYALQQALDTKMACSAFVRSYRGTPSGQKRLLAQRCVQGRAGQAGPPPQRARCKEVQPGWQ